MQVMLKPPRQGLTTIFQMRSEVKKKVILIEVSSQEGAGPDLEPGLPISRLHQELVMTY